MYLVHKKAISKRSTPTQAVNFRIIILLIISILLLLGLLKGDFNKTVKNGANI
jgi:hypothetical protein